MQNISNNRISRIYHFHRQICHANSFHHPSGIPRETSSREVHSRVNFATEGCLNCLTRQDGLIVWASHEIYSRLRAPCLVDDPRQGNRVINTPPKRHGSKLELRV